MTEFAGTAKPITALEVAQTAKSIGVDTAVLRAVMAVEARNSGFDSKRRPIILFEPHVFFRNLSGGDRTRAVNAGVAYQRWGSQGYPPGQDAQYARLKKAMQINAEAAFRSISVGLGQVLGENFALAGCSSAREMFEQAKQSEANQLRHMANFIKNKSLADELQRRDWKKFARYYNGTGQVDKYAGWLEREYQKWKKITAKPREELTARDLKEAGSKTIAATDEAKKAVATATVVGPAAGVTLDAIKTGLEPVTKAVETAQQAQSAWEWFSENWQFLATVFLTVLFLVACWYAWRAVKAAEAERVQNARDGMNLRI